MIQQALHKLRPGAQWSIDGETYEGIIWHDDTIPPTEEEVAAEIAQLIHVHVCYTNRINAYPPIAEQLDMIFHDIDQWRETIKAIKEKYPKP